MKVRMLVCFETDDLEKTNKPFIMQKEGDWEITAVYVNGKQPVKYYFDSGINQWIKREKGKPNGK
jgi:hypothetical protein